MPRKSHAMKPMVDVLAFRWNTQVTKAQGVLVVAQRLRSASLSAEHTRVSKLVRRRIDDHVEQGKLHPICREPVTFRWLEFASWVLEQDWVRSGTFNDVRASVDSFIRRAALDAALDPVVLTATATVQDSPLDPDVQKRMKDLQLELAAALQREAALRSESGELQERVGKLEAELAVKRTQRRGGAKGGNAGKGVAKGRSD